MFQEDLDRFLHIAQKLKLDGLIGKQDDPSSTVMKDESLDVEEEVLDENVKTSI